MKNIHTILFDFDGVILNSAPDICNAVNATLTHFSLHTIEAHTIVSFVGDGARALIERAITHSIRINNTNANATATQTPVDDILAWYLSYYTEHAVLDSVLYPDVCNTLETLKKQGVAMGIVSNKPYAITKKIINIFGIVDYFGSLMCPESLSHIKPHPEGILKALNELHAEKTTAVMVGDSASDIYAAKNADIYACAFNGGLGDKEALRAAPADIRIDALSELIAITANRLPYCSL